MVRTLTDQQEVRVTTGRARLDGVLTLPGGARGVVLFAHGSGSGRNSPRNRAVAQALHEAGLATLLLDLLTPQEAALDSRTAELRFDIRLLAERLLGAALWLGARPETSALRPGFFGASTGGGAALAAAASAPDLVGAVVSRGGRPDLAGAVLAQVRAPSLLIVGADDENVLALNRQAYDTLHCERRLEVVPGASHLFEEPGKLELVSRMARDWFLQHLGSRSPAEAQAITATR